MQDHLLNDWEKRFRRYLVYSLLGHLGLFLFFSVKAILFNVPEVDVSSAMLVELVALPDKIVSEPPASLPVEKVSNDLPSKPAEAVKIPEPKALPTPPKLDDAINLDKARKKQSDALKKLQQQEALEKLQKEMDQETRLKAMDQARKQFKGNVITPGTSLTGTQKYIQQNYTTEIDRIFRSNWSLPQYLKGKDYSVAIVVKFDEQGNVIASEVAKSSGNPLFDEMALTAVRKSSPVPPPPEQFVQVAKLAGFLFRFSE